MFTNKISSISFKKNTAGFIDICIARGEKPFKKTCSDAADLEHTLLDLKNDTSEEILVDLIVEWINNESDVESIENLYDRIGMCLYNIGVLDQFDTKNVLFIQVPQDGSILSLEKNSPMPEKFLKSADFKESRIDAIMVDFTKTGYIDSMTVSYFLKLNSILKNTGKTLEFCGLTNPSIIKVLKFTKIHDLLKKEYENQDDFYRRCAKPASEYNSTQLLHIYAKNNYSQYELELL